MMKLGEKQVLKVERFRDFGAYLSDGESTVLLPKKELPENLREGDEIEVFLYKDSSDRLIATTRQSALTLHQTALLKVREVSKIGAFLDWGLEKDLLLPFHEQTRRVQAGEEVLAALYIDKSGRLAATMNVYPYLRTDSPYLPDQTVQGRIYEKSDNFGVFVAVDDQFSTLIPRKEAQGNCTVGEIMDARVTEVKEDGKGADCGEEPTASGGAETEGN